MNIVELFAHIGIKADHAQADQFLSSMRKGTADLLKMVGITASLAAAIKMVNDSFQQSLELKKFTAETGASTAELQKWQQVADQASGSGAAVADSIRAIATNQEKIKLGQGNISGYQMLGIDPRMNPFQVLEQLRTKLRGLAPAMQKNLLESFGISGDLLMTLQLTNKQFDEMAGKAWVVSPAAIDGMNRARSALTEAGQAINYFKNLIAAKLAPEITKLVRQFTEWARVNQTQILAGIQKAWDFLKRFIEAIIHAGMVINDLVKYMGGWKIALAAIAFAISPVTAGILALLLVLDDLYVYSKGGKSLFGELMKNFPALKGPLKDFFQLISDSGKQFRELLSGNQSGMDAFIQKWATLGIIIEQIFGALTLMRDLEKGIFSGDWSSLRNNPIFASMRSGWAIDSKNIAEGWAKFKQGISNEWNAAQGNQVNWGIRGYHPGGMNLAQAASQVNNIEVTIQGSGLSETELGRAIERSLGVVMSRAQARLNLGTSQEAP